MTTRLTLTPAALILIGLLLGIVAVGNYIVGQVLSADGVLLVFLVGAPLVVGAVLVLLLPRCVASDGVPQAMKPAPGSAETQAAVPVLAPAKPPVDAAIQLLTLLQREGRLVDFLREDIQPYEDAQIGAAVRTIHASCRQVLTEHLALEPVLNGQEGDEVTVPEGFDPAAIRLTGNVSGEPPFRGALRHAGWRVARVTLPAQPAGQDPQIVAPAEVEIP